MSLFVVIRVNSKDLGLLTIGRIAEGDGEVNTYEYTLKMDKVPDLNGDTHECIKSGIVLHDYRNGALELVKCVMEKL